jgi:hypothetical protein
MQRPPRPDGSESVAENVRRKIALRLTVGIYAGFRHGWACDEPTAHAAPHDETAAVSAGGASQDG